MCKCGDPRSDHHESGDESGWKTPKTDAYGEMTFSDERTGKASIRAVVISSDNHHDTPLFAAYGCSCKDSVLHIMTASRLGVNYIKSIPIPHLLQIRIPIPITPKIPIPIINSISK